VTAFVGRSRLKGVTVFAGETTYERRTPMRSSEKVVARRAIRGGLFLAVVLMLSACGDDITGSGDRSEGRNPPVVDVEEAK
jgi:hypothetical protein